MVGDGMVIFGVTCGDRFEELEIVDENARRPRQLAGDLQRRRRVVAGAGGGMKPHREF